MWPQISEMPSLLNGALSISAVCVCVCVLSLLPCFLNNEFDVWSLHASLYAIMKSIVCCWTTKCMCKWMRSCLCVCVCVCGEWVVGVTLGDGQPPIGRDLKRHALFFLWTKIRHGTSRPHCEQRRWRVIVLAVHQKTRLTRIASSAFPDVRVHTRGKNKKKKPFLSGNCATVGDWQLLLRFVLVSRGPFPVEWQ